jgi:hypothetical protein
MEIYLVFETLCFLVLRIPDGAQMSSIIFNARLDTFMAQGFTQPLTEMSTRSRKIIFLGSRALPVRRTDNFTAICEPIV